MWTWIEWAWTLLGDAFVGVGLIFLAILFPGHVDIDRDKHPILAVLSTGFTVGFILFVASLIVRSFLRRG